MSATQQSNVGLYNLEVRFNRNQHDEVMECLWSEMKMMVSDGDRMNFSALRPEDYSSGMSEAVRHLETKFVLLFRSFDGASCVKLAAARKFVNLNRFHSYLAEFNQESLSLGVDGAFMTVIESGWPSK
jgi:hypothetical protein